VLVHSSPKPVSTALDGRTHLVEMPPGTPPGSPVAQVFSEEGSKLNIPFAKCFVADLNPALMEQFLHVTVNQGEAVIKPNGMLNDDHRESVAVRLGVGHDGSAYPDPVKANASKLKGSC